MVRNETRESLIHKRNVLLIRLLFIYYILMTIVYFGMDPVFSTIWPPVGLVVCLCLLFILFYSTNSQITMYSIIIGYFLYLFFLNYQYPYLVNYIFIFFGIILSSLYQSYRAVFLSGALSFLLLTYFFIFHFDTIFFQVDNFDLAYFILFSVFMVLFFFYQIRFTKYLWKRAEEKQNLTAEELHSTQEYLQSFFNHSAEAIIVGDLIGNVIEVNPAFEKLYGWKKEELIGKPIPIIPKEYRKDAKERWKKVIDGEVIHSHNTKHICKNGEWKDVEISISPIKDVEGNIVALSGILRDITEKKKTEEKLVNTEKLSVLGQIAAGLAHEIRNPLAVISGYIQLMTKDNKNNERYSNIMLSEINRINLITSELLYLGKPQTVHFKQTDISEVLQEVITLFDPQMTLRKINVGIHFQHKISFCYGDHNQLKQVFVNLVKNAIEAMPNGGELSVGLGETGKNIVITISDNGVGIPKDALEKIKEPFYTTKKDGTGLGLLVSQQIIELHGGKLTIKSEKGTEVIIQLPAMKE